MIFLKKRFIFLNLTLEDTFFYKGIAILLIIFHNFLHMLPPSIGENEQDFDILRWEQYIQILSVQPELFFQLISSFWGHYGVQLFLFLSAYGLTKRYRNSQIIYIEFLKYRISKIYPAFLLSILFWAIYISSNFEFIDVLLRYWKQIVVKLLFISNFIPNQLYSLNGPWWFVSLIVQFYILFPILLFLYKKYGKISLIVLSVGSLFLTLFFQPFLSIPIPGTLLTHIPELCFGIFLAQQKEFSLSYITIFIIMGIFLLSNYYYSMWLLSYLTVLILLLVIFQTILIRLNQTIKKGIIFIGSISMYIFYINGFMRKPWLDYAKHYNEWYLNIILCFVFVFIVVIAAYLMQQFFKEIERFNKRR
jgi:peptidoglycan/LPS O-acetylase OafA/YrhL